MCTRLALRDLAKPLRDFAGYLLRVLMLNNYFLIMKYNCLIVDDERPALKLLAAYIAKLPHLQLTASCENAMQAIAALQEYKIDLLFLDIQMPDLTGLELLKVLKEKPQVVLTTAYRDYAVEGFALDVTDYLVKPFSFERFVQAVNKGTEQINQKTSKPSPAKAAPDIAVESDHFFVRTNHKMEKVELKEILYVESMREYISIYTKDRRYVTHQTMNKMAGELLADKFMRVHRSYIVGLSHINAINGNMIVIADKNIPIGASYRKAFFEQVKLL
ncbi:MAG TPA: response regulator transcription factor [Bacteroidetes bacterium]|nr:response regulator transcription factor [Bacteroidota bacterium]